MMFTEGARLRDAGSSSGTPVGSPRNDRWPMTDDRSSGILWPSVIGHRPFSGTTPNTGRALLGSRTFALEVDLMEPAIERRAMAQLALGADGLDPAGVHEHDPVGELEGTEAVGDQEGRAISGEL